jgi:2-methylcitrate dehydratase PrpD
MNMKLTRREMGQTTLMGLGAALCGGASLEASPRSGPGAGPAAPTGPQESGQKSESPAEWPNGKGLSRYVAEFVASTTYAEIPQEVIDIGKKSILDGFGLAIAGSVGASGGITRTYLKSLGDCVAQATVIGSAMKTPTRFAAFANGVGIHADDYDDTQLASAPDRVYGLLTHPTAPVLPAAFALAEAGGVSGRDLMLAYHLGVEVECKIAEAISPRHYEDGFHTTGTIGVFGAAAAAAKLHRMDTDGCLHSLGVAGSEGSGLRINFGTMTKPFHAGHAAEGGVLAADLTALGWTSTDRILEAPTGFFHAAGGGYDLNAILHKLGNPWTFASPGVSIKPFPSGSLTHPGMTEMQRLVKENKITPDEVERVDVGTNRYMPTALIYHQPKTGLEAKFSMEYSMAVILLYGRGTLNEYTNEAVNRPEAQELMKRIHFYVSPEAEKGGYSKMTTIIDIHLKDGRTISGREDVAKGNPANPMSFDEVAEKFRGNTAYAKWPSAKADAIVEAVRKLEDMPDVRTLAALCAA